MTVSRCRVGAYGSYTPTWATRVRCSEESLSPVAPGSTFRFRLRP